MPLELTERPARITKFETDKRAADNPEENAPAIAEVGFELNLPSELLVGLHPNLRSLLFHKNGAVQHDLASQTHDAPDVRFPSLLYPLKFKESWEGATVTIHKGLGGKSDLVLDEADITTFLVTPKEGGTCILEFMSRSKPGNDAAFGRLAAMLKTEVSISLAPPHHEDGEGEEE